MCGTIEARETSCLGGNRITREAERDMEYIGFYELWPQKPNSSTKNSYLIATFGLAWNSSIKLIFHTR